MCRGLHEIIGHVVICTARIHLAFETNTWEPVQGPPIMN